MASRKATPPESRRSNIGQITAQSWTEDPNRPKAHRLNRIVRISLIVADLLSQAERLILLAA